MNNISIVYIVVTSGALVLIGIILIGIIFYCFLDKQKREKKEKFENFLATHEARVKEAKAKLSEALSALLLEGLNTEELSSKLLSKLEIAGYIFMKKDSKLIKNLVNSYHQQFSSYHQEALCQARIFFWFSVVAFTIGFCCILYGAYFFSATDNWPTVVLVLPGFAINAVAVLILKQAEQTRQRSTELYDLLRTDNQVAKAKVLLSSIEDVKIRSIAQVQIALHMSGVSTKNLDVTRLIEK